MSTVLSIEPMTEADVDWIVDAEARLHAFPWTRGNFIDSLQAGYACWSMRRDDVPVAYAVMLLVLDEAHLLNISVCEAAQRQGIATTFLNHLIGQARSCGATQMFLEVRPSNEAALTLYRRQAFQAVGRRKHYYPAPAGEREDAIVMRRDL